MVLHTSDFLKFRLGCTGGWNFEFFQVLCRVHLVFIRKVGKKLYYVPSSFLLSNIQTLYSILILIYKKKTIIWLYKAYVSCPTIMNQLSPHLKKSIYFDCQNYYSSCCLQRSRVKTPNSLSMRVIRHYLTYNET